MYFNIIKNSYGGTHILFYSANANLHKSTNYILTIKIVKFLMTDIPKSTHGGKRPGTGQPKKEETATINFRLTKSKIKYLKETYGKNLNAMFREWIEKL